MKCNVYVHGDSTLKLCGEPAVINNCCEKHAVVCGECNKNLAHPYSSICRECHIKEMMVVEDMNNVTYEEIPDYGDLMTLKDFKELCKCGGFIDYDGIGNYAFENKMSNFSTYPSKFLLNPDNRFTHIVWFNR